jgi:hypothetical protein
MKLSKVAREAMRRLKLLKVHKKVINDYKKGQINISERFNKDDAVLLYHPTEEEQYIIGKLEDKYAIHIYHIQKTDTNFGMLYTCLYVALDNENEWEIEAQYLSNGHSLAYVYNDDNPHLSQFGSVVVKPMNGGIIRIL